MSISPSLLNPLHMQLQNHLVSMKWYFDKAGGRRFRWIRLEKQEEGTISVRIAALVEVADGTETWQDFIIKTPFWGGNDLVNDEYELLKVIKGPHIIRRFCLAGNPLDEDLTIEDTHFPGSYIVLECLENGSLSEFIRRAKVAGVPHISNRLLWLMFRCLVSMCVEMEYPEPMVSVTGHDSQQLNNVWDRIPTGFRHPDLSTNNILMGGYEPGSADHQACPVLKLTSFGRKPQDQQMSEASKTNAPKQNLCCVALIMQYLIILNDNVTQRKGYFGNPHEAPKETEAGWLIPALDDGSTWSFIWLDTELRHLVMHCAATDKDDRPDLRSVWLRIEEIMARQEASGIADSDRQVRLFFQRLAFTL